MRSGRWIFLVFVISLVGATSRFVEFEHGAPIDNRQGTKVWVFDHGYHAGLVLPRGMLERLGSEKSANWMAQYPDAEWFEFGWGDAGFYFEVPTFADVTVAIAANALFVPSESVVHIAAGRGAPGDAFPRSDHVTLSLSDGALSNIIAFVEGSVASTEALGTGLYGVSAFYEGLGRYHIFNTCNSWVSQALRSGGVASAPGPSILSAGLLWDLRLRYAKAS